MVYSVASVKESVLLLHYRPFTGSSEDVVQPLQVSLRRQEIADRLNAWTIFNDKNKQFCDWLTQMENKVSHRGDLSIEEMVEKLKKVRETGDHASNTWARATRP